MIGWNTVPQDTLSSFRSDDNGSWRANSICSRLRKWTQPKAWRTSLFGASLWAALLPWAAPARELRGRARFVPRVNYSRPQYFSSESGHIKQHQLPDWRRLWENPSPCLSCSWVAGFLRGLMWGWSGWMQTEDKNPKKLCPKTTIFYKRLLNSQTNISFLACLDYMEPIQENNMFWIILGYSLLLSLSGCQAFRSQHSSF